MLFAVSMNKNRSRSKSSRQTSSYRSFNHNKKNTMNDHHDGYNVHCHNNKKSKRKIHHKSTTSNTKKTNKNNHPHKEQLKYSNPKYQHEGKIHHNNNNTNHHKSKQPKSKSLSSKPALPSGTYYNHQTRSTSNSISKEDEKTQTINTSTSTSKSDNFNLQRYPKLISLAEKKLSIKTQQQDIINAFIGFISTTNTAERQEMMAYLQNGYNFDIIAFINENFKGMLKRIFLYSMQTQMQRDLYLLTIAVKKMKDIHCILDILCLYNGRKLKTTMSLYQRSMFEKSLESQIIKLTKDNSMIRSFLQGILNGSRQTENDTITDVNNQLHEAIEHDLKFLKRILSECEWGITDQVDFIYIFTRRSFQYLQKLCISFENQVGISLIDSIRAALGCKTNIFYAVDNILMFSNDQNEYYRCKINKGIIYGGHKHIKFWKFIIDHMDNDLEVILNGYGRYEGGVSDVEKYAFSYHIETILAKEDQNVSKLLKKICGIEDDEQ